MLEGAELRESQRKQVQFLQDLKDRLTRELVASVLDFEKQTSLCVESIDVYRTPIDRLGGHAGESQLQNLVVRISI